MKKILITPLLRIGWFNVLLAYYQRAIDTHYKQQKLKVKFEKKNLDYVPFENVMIQCYTYTCKDLQFIFQGQLLQ